MTKRYRKRPRLREPKPKYIAKAYRPLLEQLDLLRMGSLSSAMANSLFFAANRTGFARKFLAPESSRKHDAENMRLKLERETQLAAEAEKCMAAYTQYFIPYHRNRYTYPLIPNNVMHALGFRNIQDHGSDFLNSVFKKGWQ